MMSEKTYKKYYKKDKKGYNHNEWIYFLNKIIGFILAFGSVVNLIIFALFGIEVAGFTSFIAFTTVGIAKLIINTIKYFNNIYNIWNN